MINLAKLHEELEAAGIRVAGCHSDGRVWDETGDIQDRPDVAAIIAAHDPTPEPEPDYIEYKKPLKAPDFIVATPDVEATPELALTAAISEARKGKGKKKSMGKIVLNLVEYVDELEKRIKKLEKAK
jgi:hypothetical protein